MQLCSKVYNLIPMSIISVSNSANLFKIVQKKFKEYNFILTVEFLLLFPSSIIIFCHASPPTITTLTTTRLRIAHSKAAAPQYRHRQIGGIVGGDKEGGVGERGRGRRQEGRGRAREVLLSETVEEDWREKRKSVATRPREGWRRGR